MANERSSAGDPVRTLELLWRVAEHSSGRGPRQGLTVDAVVDTAIELADESGIGAVTMRGLANRLNVAAMTLYTYVPGKAELLDLMLDAGRARMHRPDMSGLGWHERLVSIAEHNRTLLRSHPWMAGVSTSRPTLGPGTLAKYEHELSALDGIGLDDIEMDAALTQVLEFVRSVVWAELARDGARAEDGKDDREWWNVAGPLLARMVGESEFPLATRVGSAAGAAHGASHDPEYSFRFGLRRIIDGLAVLIAERAGDHGSSGESLGNRRPE